MQTLAQGLCLPQAQNLPSWCEFWLSCFAWTLLFKWESLRWEDSAVHSSSEDAVTDGPCGHITGKASLGPQWALGTTACFSYQVFFKTCADKQLPELFAPECEWNSLCFGLWFPMGVYHRKSQCGGVAAAGKFFHYQQKRLKQMIRLWMAAMRGICEQGLPLILASPLKRAASAKSMLWEQGRRAVLLCGPPWTSEIQHFYWFPVIWEWEQ